MVGGDGAAQRRRARRRRVAQNNIPKIETASADLRIGERSWGSGNRFIGLLDDLRYYDRELSGLTDLNNLLGGLHRSDLIIVAGRPAMGKTALATNMAFHTATTTRTGEMAAPVAFFSLEMAAEQLGTRILSERAQIDSEQIRRGKLDGEEFDRLITASNGISAAPFFIDDTPSLSVSQLASRARRMKRTTGLGLIVVDYLQLLTPQLGVRAENRVQEISNISRTLKAIAKELDVPVLALSQLSRAVEQRDVALLVDRDDRVVGRVDHRAKARGADFQLVREMGEAGTWDALHDAMDGALCRIEARPRPS